METLPSEISQRIFSSLTYREFASAGKVCRTWRTLTSQAEEVWRTFYIRRWGQDEETAAACSLHGSWKSAFECHDRLDRVGTDWTFVREGNDIYTTEKGKLLQLLSTTSGGRISTDKESASNRNSMSTMGCETSSEILEQPYSRAGLIHKLFEVVADLRCELHKATKRARMLRD